MKNKAGVTVTWSLYRLKPYSEYPALIYAWVNPKGIITSVRSTAPIGFIPVNLENNIVGEHKKILRGSGFKKINHKMTDSELEKGWLIL